MFKKPIEKLVDAAHAREVAGATTASNGLVVFTPAEANCTGIFNPATNARCVSVNASRWGTRDREKRGATTAGDGLVVFAPHEVREQELCVGIFDPALVSWDSSAKVNIDINAASAVFRGLGISRPRSLDSFPQVPESL